MKKITGSGMFFDDFDNSAFPRLPNAKRELASSQLLAYMSIDLQQEWH